MSEQTTATERAKETIVTFLICTNKNNKNSKYAAFKPSPSEFYTVSFPILSCHVVAFKTFYVESLSPGEGGGLSKVFSLLRLKFDIFANAFIVCKIEKVERKKSCLA